nr:hypothetical protein [Chitinophagaceae bacterium]
EISGGSSVVDSLVYATKANVIKVRDSLLAADNFWSGVNTFQNNLNVSNDLQLGAANASYGNAIFYNANNSNKVQIFSSDTLAKDVGIELPTSSGKLALTTDIAIVDTSIISTKAYVNYKDDIQQGFIDMRKLESDSIAWTGYATRARLQQQLDSANAAQAVINGVQNDTLTSHNTRILANQNATNTNAANIALKVNIADTTSMLAGYRDASILSTGTLLDARLSSNVNLLNATQTITADKTTTALFTANANNLDTTQNETKGVTLSNESASTVGTPNQISPALILKGSVWNTGASIGGIAAGANTTKWKIENTSLSGNTANNMDNYLDISMAWGSNGYTRIGRFTKAGLETNLFQNTLTLGQPGNAGTLILNRSSGGGIGSITGQPSGISIASQYIFLATSGYISLGGNPSFGTRYTPTDGLFIASEATVATAPLSRLSVVGNASIGSNTAAPTNGLLVAGNTGLGDVTTVSAKLHIAGSSAGAAGTASLKVNSGTILTTPEAGVIENDGTDFYLTNNALTRAKIPRISGTTNYIPKFTATNDLGNSSIFENSGNVGIGTTAPTGLLQVHGSANEVIVDLTGRVGIGFANASAMNASAAYKLQVNGAFTFGDGTNILGRSTYTAVGGNPAFASESGKGFTFYVDNANVRAIDISSAGNVGIGTTTPTARVHVLASSTSASGGQIKLTGGGSRQSTPENGTINNVSGNLEFVDGGVVYILAKTLQKTSTLDFGSIASLSTSTLTVTLTGAADGDLVYIGVPSAAYTAGLIFTARVSATDTVSIDCYNSTGSNIDPASASFKISIVK